MQYEVELNAPNYFIIGSDGGGEALAIERNSGHIYKLPFIGMSNIDAQYICDTFDEFISLLENA
jgi:hypothetical protein